MRMKVKKALEVIGMMIINLRRLKDMDNEI